MGWRIEVGGVEDRGRWGGGEGGWRIEVGGVEGRVGGG